MLDYRAWLFAGLFLLGVGGACVYWITRPQAVMPSRSLSAASRPAHAPASEIKSLHVAGCVDDFLVKQGELVEPRVVPGSLIELFRNVYGKEEAHRDEGTLSWDRNAFLLTEGNFGAENPRNFVRLSVHQGHVVETLDGIELGIDAFGTIFRKMRDRKIDVRERIERGDGNWTLTVSLYSACGKKFRSEYRRTLPGSAEVDRLILPRATAQGDAASVWRSDVFMNKIVTEYALVPSDGRDESHDCLLSSHD